LIIQELFQDTKTYTDVFNHVSAIWQVPNEKWIAVQIHAYVAPISSYKLKTIRGFAYKTNAATTKLTLILEKTC
jgi:hypothetical protein